MRGIRNCVGWLVLVVLWWEGSARGGTNDLLLVFWGVAVDMYQVDFGGI